MWLTCLVTTVVVCLMVGKGNAQTRTPPTTRGPTTRPTPVTSEPEGCITRVRNQGGIQSQPRYIVVPKRGQSRRAFAKKISPIVFRIPEGAEALPTVAVLSARERANVSCSRNYKLLYAC